MKKKVIGCLQNELFFSWLIFTIIKNTTLYYTTENWRQNHKGYTRVGNFIIYFFQ